MSTHIGDTFRYLDATVVVVAVGSNDDAFPVRDGEVGIRAVTHADAVMLGWWSPCTNGEFEAITDFAEFLSTAEPIATAQQFEAGNPVLVDNGREGRVTSVHDGYVWVSVKDPLVNTGWRPANGYHPTDVQHADPTGALTLPPGVDIAPPPGMSAEARQRLADDFAALAAAGSVAHAPSSQAGLASFVPSLVQLDAAEAVKEAEAEIIVAAVAWDDVRETGIATAVEVAAQQLADAIAAYRAVPR